MLFHTVSTISVFEVTYCGPFLFPLSASTQFPPHVLLPPFPSHTLIVPSPFPLVSSILNVLLELHLPGFVYFRMSRGADVYKHLKLSFNVLFYNAIY